MAERKLIGTVSVDSGLCLLMDPCYIIGKPVTEWQAWLRKYVDQDDDGSQQWTHALIDKLGVVVSTGYGDGVYPVYATIENGRVLSVIVEFDQ